MQQVKLFKGVEAELGQIEDEVNAWLMDSGARVVQMQASIAPQTAGSGTGLGGGRAFSPSDVLIAVLYETS